jgi:hypothetical protein
MNNKQEFCNEIKSPFGSAAVFFFKTQLQPFGYKKLWYTVHWVPPFFCVGNAVFAKQELLAFFALFT